MKESDKMAFDTKDNVSLANYDIEVSDLFQNLYDGSNGNQSTYAYGGFRNIDLGQYTIASFFQGSGEGDGQSEDNNIVNNYGTNTQSSNVYYVNHDNSSERSGASYPVDGRTGESLIYKDLPTGESTSINIPLLKEYRNVQNKITVSSLANARHINGLKSKLPELQEFVDKRFTHIQSFTTTLYTITYNEGSPFYEEPFKAFTYTTKNTTVNLKDYIPNGKDYDENLWNNGYRIQGNTIEYIDIDVKSEIGLPSTSPTGSRSWSSNLVLNPVIITQYGNQVAYIRLYSYLRQSLITTQNLNITVKNQKLDVYSAFDYPRNTSGGQFNAWYQTLKEDTSESKSVVVTFEVPDIINKAPIFTASGTSWRNLLILSEGKPVFYNQYNNTTWQYVSPIIPLSRLVQVLAISGLPYMSGSTPSNIPVDISLVDATASWVDNFCVGRTESGIYTGELLWGKDALEELGNNPGIKNEDYEPVYPDTSGGGGGGADPDSDKNVDPSSRNGDNIGLNLDNRLATFNGFLTMYNMNYQQLANFGKALMGEPLNYRGNFEKDLSDELSGTYDVSSILNYIVSVKQYPFSVATLPNTSTAGVSSVYIGTGEFGVPIGTSCRILTSSISVLNAGRVVVKPVDPYNDFRDYYNTTVTAYLPFCGTVELNPMEIIGSLVECYYLIDFFTGECTAVLYSTYNGMSFPVAMANGVIGIDVPLSATNSGQLTAVKRMQNAETAHTVVSFANSGIGIIGEAVRMGMDASKGKLKPKDATYSAESMLYNVTSIVDTAFSNQANPYGANRSARSAVASPMMPTGSGATNVMLPSSAYIQIRRGTYSRPDNYPRTMAYPNSYSARLSSVSGFTVCHNVNVSGIDCTTEEKQMIKSALESGVIL